MNQRTTLTFKRSAAAFLSLALAAAPAAMALPRSQGARQPTASQTARKVEQDALAQLKLANDNLAKARMRVEVAIKSARPDWQSAQKDHDKAKVDLDTATRAALSKLKTRADYKAASTAKDATDAKYRQLTEDPKGNQAELETLAQQRAAHVVTMKKMEGEALENDPKVIDAKARLAEAKAKVDSFKSEVDLAARSDPEYVAAEQQVQVVQQQVATARQQVADAMKADGAARAAESKARAEAAKAKSKGSGGGGNTGY